MIDPASAPASDRVLCTAPVWNTRGEDFVPPASELAADLARHDQAFHTALRSRPGAPDGEQLLYGRWFCLTKPLRPLAEAPFRQLADACRESGWGLSAALFCGKVREIDTLVAIARHLTRVELHLPFAGEVADRDILEAIDRLARSPVALVLCGDVNRYRAIGATQLPALIHRPHRYRTDPPGSEYGKLASKPDECEFDHGHDVV